MMASHPDSEKSDINERENPLTRFLEGKKETYTKLLFDLIKAKTTNPPGDEFLAAKILKKKLSKSGIDCKIHEKIRHRSNLIARIGNEKGKKIVISTHLDTAPPGEGWNTDPFIPVLDDGRVYGRGASDNKGQAVAITIAAEYLKSIEQTLENQYMFLYTADEELGSSLGVKYLLNEGIIKPDMAIIIDIGGEMKKIGIAEKGILNLKIKAKGKQANGSTPHKGISAIAAMARLIAKLEHHPLKCRLHTYLSRPTINFGTISGGTTPNIVAGNCELIVNIRYLPSQTPEQIINELREISQMYGDFEFETMMKLPPSEIDNNHELVRTIKSVAEKHSLKPALYGLAGATDAKTFILQGIPAVVYDFTEDDMAYSSNESIELSKLFEFSEVLIDICLEFNKANK